VNTSSQTLDTKIVIVETLLRVAYGPIALSSKTLN